MHDHLEVGKIVNTHGVKGEVRVLPLTDNPDRFQKLKWAFIERNGTFEKININGVKFLKNMVILKLEGVDDVDAALALKEKFLLVDRENAVKLPKDSFFICDLIGLEVFEENGTHLGKLTNVLQTGSNDVYIVTGANKKEILIPALKSVVKEVDIESGKITVLLPEGLLDDEI